MTDLLLTGATGAIGPQLALQWLDRHPGSRLYCPVRASSTESARHRLLATASWVADRPLPVDALQQLVVCPDDLTDVDLPRKLRSLVAGSSGFEVIHAAANLSFDQRQEQAVWKMNVGATDAFLLHYEAIRICMRSTM